MSISNSSHSMESRLPSAVYWKLPSAEIETLEYGVSDGEFYFENKVLEGIDEGSSISKKIDKQHFGEVLENERRLCEKYAPQLLEQVTKRLEEICGKLELGKIKESETPSWQISESVI